MARPIAAAAAILVFLFAGQAGALWLFTRGFLLTRTTLEGTASCAVAPQQTWIPPKPALQSLQTDADFDQWESALASHAECTLPSTYSRTFLWVIDALRYDFIADARTPEPQSKVPSPSNVGDSIWSPNAHYHNVLDTPARLDKEAKSFSFLAHFVADAPTTTLQRLKGLTTGSLPTFIDAGSNFGGSEIQEDNWLAQLRKDVQPGRHAKMGFAGDDTWLSVFPTMFDDGWRFPFDSFNVEDLDGVDRGVATQLEQFLDGKNSSTSDWRLLVSHTLGVDHVGHRLGASHPRMREKLGEMQEFLHSTLERLPDDALFILMGDHGMDDRGDHGGDGELEVGAGLWMYSKKKMRKIPTEELDFIRNPSESLIPSHQQFSMLPSPPFAPQGHRSIPQIDFVPTLSLVLGLPVPFNNLGSVIPEAFESTNTLLRASRINAMQIHAYLATYAKSSGDLKPFQASLTAAWREALKNDFLLGQTVFRTIRPLPDIKQVEREAAQAYLYFNRLALVRARGIWAKFENVKIILGVFTLGLNIAVIVMMKRAFPISDVELALMQVFASSRSGAVIGAGTGLAAKLTSLFVAPLLVMQSVTLVESVVAGLLIGAQIGVLSTLSSQKTLMRDWSLLGAALPIVHALAFSSNSFTVHEDKIVLALAATVFAYRAVQGFVASPTARLKVRIPYLAVIGGVVLRIAAYSRVCREEQGRNCQTTFYADIQSSLNSPFALGLSYMFALGLSALIGRVLSFSRSDAGVAPLFLTWVLRPALLCGAGYWVIDWALTSGALDVRENTPAHAALDWAKLAVARADFAILGPIALAFWFFSPLCLELSQEPFEGAAEGRRRPDTGSGATASPQRRVVILGFANSFGSSYMLFFSIILAVHYLFAQAMGQIALGLVFVAILACAELGDAERDVKLIQAAIAGSQQRDSATTATAMRSFEGRAIGGGSSRNVRKNAASTPAAAPAAASNPAISSTQSLPVSMLETSTLALIGFVAFFATGHQATFASIQWRTAFVGFRTVQYPFAPSFVILNSFGPLALLTSLAVPLLVLWNLSPIPRGRPTRAGETARDVPGPGPAFRGDPEEASGEVDEDQARMPTVMHVLQASLSLILYFSIIAFATAVFAAHFRRHL